MCVIGNPPYSGESANKGEWITKLMEAYKREPGGVEKLRERVTQKHGQIDAEVAKWLMSRPVAMTSNLHNVLFVPADGILYVANADHKRPAAERPYVKLDLNELLGTLPQLAGK